MVGNINLGNYEIFLQQLIGKCKGLLNVEPIDVIYARNKGTGQVGKLGFVCHHEQAPVLFVRFLPPSIRDQIAKIVKQIRHDNDSYSVSDLIVCPPDPRLVKAYIKGDIKRKMTKTTVVAPDGEPFATGEPETEVDELLETPAVDDADSESDD